MAVRRRLRSLPIGLAGSRGLALRRAAAIKAAACAASSAGLIPPSGRAVAGSARAASVGRVATDRKAPSAPGVKGIDRRSRAGPSLPASRFWEGPWVLGHGPIVAAARDRKIGVGWRPAPANRRKGWAGRAPARPTRFAPGGWRLPGWAGEGGAGEDRRRTQPPPNLRGAVALLRLPLAYSGMRNRRPGRI
jgi:hypothetical protein